MPRLKKIAFSPEWKQGVATRSATAEEAERGPRIIKYFRLESYEDALNNIEFEPETQEGLFGMEDYMLRYMLRWETRRSATFLNVAALERPFDYKLRLNGNADGEDVAVDVPETFNYLLGLAVRTRRVYDDDGRRYLVYTGRTRDGRETVVIWRNTKGWKLEDRERDRDFVAEHQLTAGADDIWMNGDSMVEDAKPLDALFKKRMFAGRGRLTGRLARDVPGVPAPHAQADRVGAHAPRLGQPAVRVQVEQGALRQDEGHGRGVRLGRAQPCGPGARGQRGQPSGPWPSRPLRRQRAPPPREDQRAATGADHASLLPAAGRALRGAVPRPSHQAGGAGRGDRPIRAGEGSHRHARRPEVHDRRPRQAGVLDGHGERQDADHAPQLPAVPALRVCRAGGQHHPDHAQRGAERPAHGRDGGVGHPVRALRGDRAARGPPRDRSRDRDHQAGREEGGEGDGRPA